MKKNSRPESIERFKQHVARARQYVVMNGDDINVQNVWDAQVELMRAGKMLARLVHSFRKGGITLPREVTAKSPTQLYVLETLGTTKLGRKED